MADYVAKSVIFLDGVAAYQPGDTVASDVVEQHGWQEQVAKAGTKAAEHAAPDAGKP